MERVAGTREPWEGDETWEKWKLNLCWANFLHMCFFWGGEKKKGVKLDQLGNHDLSKYFGMLPHPVAVANQRLTEGSSITDYTDPGGHCLLLERSNSIPYKKMMSSTPFFVECPLGLWKLFQLSIMTTPLHENLPVEASCWAEKNTKKTNGPSIVDRP